jgi:hypothetical protein
VVRCHQPVGRSGRPGPTHPVPPPHRAAGQQCGSDHEDGEPGRRENEYPRQRLGHARTVPTLPLPRDERVLELAEHLIGLVTGRIGGEDSAHVVGQVGLELGAERPEALGDVPRSLPELDQTLA